LVGESHVDIPDVETIPPQPTSYNHIDVYRTPGQQGGFLPTKNDISNCLEIPKYRDFTLELEGLHNGVHAWVGGTMTDIKDFRRPAVLDAPCKRR
jgi:hypothetical protein